MANSDSSVMEFSEVVGPTILQLFSRALPYRPLRIGGRQRAEFTWYPGSSGAVVQMLGPTEEPITMNGFWKDRFIGVGDGTTGMAFYNGEPIYAVTSLVDLVDSLRRSGKKFKLSWDKLVRFGHITSFTQTWHTPHDCEWELEFSVSAQEAEAAPFVRGDPTSVQSFSYTFDAAALNIPPVIASLTDQMKALVYAAQTAISNVSAKIGNTAINLTEQVFSPLAAARALSSTTAQGVASIATATGTITDRAIAEYFAFAGGQNASPIGQQVAAYSYVNDWRAAGKSLTGMCAVTRYETEKQLQSQLIASFVADREMDFRDVSMEFYGTQDSWRELMIRNGYPTSALHPGDLVWVPQRTTVAGDGGAGSAGRSGRV